MHSSPKPTRLPLGRTARRQLFERRLRLALVALAMPTVGSLLGVTWLLWHSASLTGTLTLLVVLGWALVASLLFDSVVRPLQTLSNVVAALREDDFSFRARGGRRGDALGDLALEINALAGTLQEQRTSALDALSLVERVLTSMQSPVLAFDDAGTLRLQNAAAAQLFTPEDAEALDPLLRLEDGALYPPVAGSARTRWQVRRTTFRLQGVPHTLLVLSDVGAALRDEERTAWQRLIRVLGHEINNSLTPIQSIAGTLRTRLEQRSALHTEDFARGLGVIEDRSASLHRFLQAYQRLSRLPAPSLRPAELGSLVASVVALEQRLRTEVQAGPPVSLLCDSDQVEQALINLLRNAVEAALDPESVRQPRVAIGWHTRPGEVLLYIDDSGPGVTNPGNLFVPFYTTKPGGSGIGLALAQAVISAHNGQITLGAEPSSLGGCRAEIVLPL